MCFSYDGLPSSFPFSDKYLTRISISHLKDHTITATRERIGPGREIMGELLRASLAKAPVVKMGDYDYVVHPLTDGVPFLPPELLTEVTDEILALGDFDVDFILTAEAMGIPLATALSLRTGIPLTITRKRQYGLEGEKEIVQRTGYSSSRMYINGLNKGDTVVIVDDILSTGRTLKALLEKLREMGVIVKDIVVVIQKKHAKQAQREIEQAFSIRVKSLIIY